MSTAVQALSLEADQKTRDDDLWRQYRLSFEVFALKVEEMQQLQAAGNTPPAVLVYALREVDNARRAHNRCRDALAEALLLRCSSYTRLDRR
jgi:hypothetical protein